MADVHPDKSPLITARDLAFSHGKTPVLKGATFNLHAGRHYIVAGPNGAGKTTLLDLLTRLKQPASGHLSVKDRPALEYSIPEYARIVALAPQESRIDFSFSVREIVSMGRRPYLDRWGRLDAEDRRIVDQAIGSVHLEYAAQKAATALSGGEARRCVVARALAQTTPVLLLDEPDSGLDVSQALSVMSLAKDLAERGALVVTVSHDLNAAARYGHNFIFLKNGKIAAQGPVAETFTSEILSAIYETEARVRYDDFAGGPAVSFRRGGTY